MPCVEIERAGVIGIHMVDCRLLATCDRGHSRSCQHDVVTGQTIGPGETAIEAGSLDLQPEEGKILEAGVKLRLGVAVEIAPPRLVTFRRAAFQPLGAAHQRDAGIGERIAAAGLAEKQRTTRIGKDKSRMLGEPRDEDDRIAGYLRRHGNTACEWRSRFGFQRGERPVAGGSEQFPGEPDAFLVGFLDNVLFFGHSFLG